MAVRPEQNLTFLISFMQNDLSVAADIMRVYYLLCAEIAINSPHDYKCKAPCTQTWPQMQWTELDCCSVARKLPWWCIKTVGNSFFPFNPPPLIHGPDSKASVSGHHLLPPITGPVWPPHADPKSGPRKCSDTALPRPTFCDIRVSLQQFSTVCVIGVSF